MKNTKKILIICCAVLLIALSFLLFYSPSSSIEQFKDGKKIETFEKNGIPGYTLDDFIICADNVVKVKVEDDAFTVLKSYKGLVKAGQSIDNLSSDGITFEEGGEYLFFISQNLPYNDDFCHIFYDAILDVKAMKATSKCGDRIFGKYRRFSSLEKYIENYDKLDVVYLDRLSDNRIRRADEGELRYFCSYNEATVTAVNERTQEFHGQVFVFYDVFFTLDDGTKCAVLANHERPTEGGTVRVYTYEKNSHVFGAIIF